MYCNACGQSIADDARYCSYCGNGVGNSHPRKMLRSRIDRRIAGVCAGLAHYLELDTALVRVLTVLITFAVGFFPGLNAYIVAWIIVPQEQFYLPVPAASQPVAS
jgi:phage shock protein C